MRRILVVDDDPHIGLAIRAWLKRYGFKVTVADRSHRAKQLNVRPDDRRYLHAQYARLRIDQGVSQSRAHGAADRDFRIRILRSGGIQPRLPENGAQAWRDAVLAQTIQANHIARCDRRMPVDGRAAPQICRHFGRRRECGVGATGQNEVISRLREDTSTC
jgi:CheY-like chemotaxis protein